MNQCEVVAKVGGSVVVRSWSSEVGHPGVPPAVPPASRVLGLPAWTVGGWRGRASAELHGLWPAGQPSPEPVFSTALELRRSSAFLRTENLGP